MADLLSLCKGTGSETECCNVDYKEINQAISQHVSDIARYSASQDDLETVCCFLHFHDTRALPNIKQ